MNSMTTVWVTIAIYAAALVAVGVITGKGKKNISDVTVGGRQAGAWLSALSYGTAYFSAVMFVGYAGSTGYGFGLWGILAGIGNAVFGSYLAWKILARKTRALTAKHNLQTMPGFFEARYGSRAMKLFACVVIFVFLIPYSASVYKGLGSISQVLLGISDTAFMVIIAVLAAVLLLLGGYKAQARADFVQGIVMLVGVSVLIVFVIGTPQVDGLAGLADYAKSDIGLPKLVGKQWVSLLSLVLMTSFGTWGLPQMIQKYFGIKDDKQARRGIWISTFFAVLVAGGGYFIGSLCYRFFTKSQMDALPTKDFIVPEMLKAAALPDILLGIVIVLLLAASVSTLCSVTLTAASTFSVDFIGTIKPKTSDKSLRMITQGLCVLFVIVSYFVANSKTPILELMSYSWGIISGSFLAPYVLALYFKWIGKRGAWAGILAGFFVALPPAVCRLLTSFPALKDNATVLWFSGNGPLFACVAMLVSLLVTAGVSALGNPRENEAFYDGLDA
ncbi:MAG: sodium:solute symporter family protein [Oscillospiraceae bacterium]|jgi:SSS family solute:Na+ symporter/sodium/proline symporter|nr:sodium:solute symporter family protein [Oscillospiraceae bacterium]